MMHITSRTIVADLDLPELTPDQEADLRRRVAEAQERLLASVFPPQPPTAHYVPARPCPDCRGCAILCFRCMAKVT